MPDPNLTADAVLARVRLVMARWPRPAAGETVPAAAVLAALRPFAPLAQLVLRLPDGYEKGYYSGAGYLSGSNHLTPADRAVATRIMLDLERVLPAVGDGVLDRVGYGQIKGRAYALLNLASDFDVSAADLAKVGTDSTAAWDSWAAMPAAAGGVVDDVKGAVKQGKDALKQGKDTLSQAQSIAVNAAEATANIKQLAHDADVAIKVVGAALVGALVIGTITIVRRK